MDSGFPCIQPDELAHEKEIKQTLFAIANAVNTTSDLPTLYREIHHSLGTVLDVTNFYIAIIDEKNKKLNFPYHVDSRAKEFRTVPDDTAPGASDSLTGLVVTQKKPVLLNASEINAVADINREDRPLPRIWMGAPLRIEGVVTGAVAVQSYEDPGCFSQKDLDILTMVSDQIALAVSRKQAEEKLNKSEKRYRTLFEKSKDAILIIKNRLFVDCNQATVDMLGYENKTRLLQTHPSQLSPQRQPDGKDSYTKANEMMDTAVRNGSHRFEWDHVRADGTVFPVEVLLTTISTEKGNQEIHTIWRDITERKKREAALRDSRRRMRAILEANPEPMVVYDLNGHPQYLNPAFTKVFGWTFDELKGRRIPFVPGDQEELTSKVIEEIFRYGKPISFEAKRLTKDRTLLYTIISAAINKNDRGEIIGIVVNLTDITERKRLEAQYKQAQKMEAIGTLAGGIAHDFNNILSGIFGYSQLAERDIENPEKVKKYLAEVVNGARRSAELVQQILTFSRQSEYQKQNLKLGLILKEAVKLVRSSIPTTIEIRTEINTEAEVLADPTKMHQVILNLATNAYHAMAKTGGTLTISLSEIRIRAPKAVKGREIHPGNYLCLNVEDTGHGMDGPTLEKVFEPYFTTKKIGKGTGFGLALVHAIVEEHDGFIEAESKLNKGSVFNIYLPEIDPATTTASRDKKKRTAINGDEHIMVVDDEAAIRSVARDVIQRYGYRVTLFENGAEAFSDFEAHPGRYDLIVSDMTMPVMTGEHLAKKVLEIKPDFPIILCTGFTENLSEEQAYELGIKKFIYKPITNRDLVAAIRETLDAP